MTKAEFLKATRRGGVPGLNGLTSSSADEGANYLDVCAQAAAEGVAEAAAAAALIRT